MQYRKGLLQQYRHKAETHPVSKIGSLSAYWRRRRRLRPLAPLDGYATMYEGFLYEYQNSGFGRMSTRGLYMYIDNLLILVARGPGILHDKMHVISGRGDRLAI